MNQMTLTLPTSLFAKLSRLATLDGVSIEEYAVYTLTERASTEWYIERVEDDEVKKQSKRFHETVKALGEPATDAEFAAYFAGLTE